MHTRATRVGLSNGILSHSPHSCNLMHGVRRWCEERASAVLYAPPPRERPSPPGHRWLSRSAETSERRIHCTARCLLVSSRKLTTSVQVVWPFAPPPVPNSLALMPAPATTCAVTVRFAGWHAWEGVVRDVVCRSGAGPVSNRCLSSSVRSAGSGQSALTSSSIARSRS